MIINCPCVEMYCGTVLTYVQSSDFDIVICELLNMWGEMCNLPDELVRVWPKVKLVRLQ